MNDMRRTLLWVLWGNIGKLTFGWVDVNNYWYAEVTVSGVDLVLQIGRVSGGVDTGLAGPVAWTAGGSAYLAICIDANTVLAFQSSNTGLKTISGSSLSYTHVDIG